MATFKCSFVTETHKRSAQNQTQKYIVTNKKVHVIEETWMPINHINSHSSSSPSSWLLFSLSSFPFCSGYSHCKSYSLLSSLFEIPFSYILWPLQYTDYL